MVEKPGCRANPNYLTDFIPFLISPRRLNNAEIKKKYLESTLSAAQLAEQYGVSKQAILGRLRAVGVHNSPGRGRSEDNYRLPVAPYGYRILNGRLEINPKEIKIARIVVELHDRQKKSFQRVAEELNNRKLKIRNGSSWTRHTVADVHKRWSKKI